MAATVVETMSPVAITYPRPIRVCFSYAAYAKNLIEHLKASDVPVEHGLTESEFSSLEATFGFTFPPDLRSILQEGLPVGQGFPNWRSSSDQQLEILTTLPILGLCKDVSTRNFWLQSWGYRPNDNDRAESLAKGILRDFPVLVPLYRHFYIPAAPCLAGNPVFYVHGGDVKLWSFDIAGFFQQAEFRRNAGDLRKSTLLNLFNAPAWAATEARRIEFWTELAERREKEEEERRGIAGWWSGDLGLGGCLEEVVWTLRNGGWKENDVREMMMMDGCDAFDRHDGHEKKDSDFRRDREGVVWHVSILSKRLLRAGWSMEDVVESLGFLENYQGSASDEDFWIDFS